MSFWSDAPIMGLTDRVKSMLPWLSIEDPSVLPESPAMPPSNKLSHWFQIDNRVHVGCTPISKTAVVQITDFLKEHFYPDSFHTKKSINPAQLQRALEKEQIQGTICREEVTGKIVGLVLARKLGNLCCKQDRNTSIPVTIVEEICVHPTYRNKGVPNQLLRQLYSQGCLMEPKRQVYLFQQDNPLQVPFAVPVLDRTKIQGREKRTPTVRVERVDLTKELLHTWRSKEFQWNPHTLWMEPETISDLIQVWQTPSAKVIVRDLNETKHPKKYGAQVLQAEGPSAHEIEKCLDATPYDWFESKEAYSNLWSFKGVTTTAAFHLHQGYPASRPVVFL